MKKKASPPDESNSGSLITSEPPTLTAAQRLKSLNSSEPTTKTEAVFRLLPEIEESVRQGRTYPQIVAELQTAGLEINTVSFKTLLSRARTKAVKRSTAQQRAGVPSSALNHPATVVAELKKTFPVTPKSDSVIDNAERIIRPKSVAVVEHNDTPSLKDFI